MDTIIVFPLLGLIVLVMLFAQLKLFSINATLQQILRILEERAKE